MKHCTYITQHPSGFYYIGKSDTVRIAKGYTGSGMRLKVSMTCPGYEKETWVTLILEEFDDEMKAYRHEEELVNHDTLRDPFCLNTCLGGRRGTRGSVWSAILKKDVRARKAAK